MATRRFYKVYKMNELRRPVKNERSVWEREKPRRNGENSADQKMRVGIGCRNDFPNVYTHHRPLPSQPIHLNSPRKKNLQREKYGLWNQTCQHTADPQVATDIWSYGFPLFNNHETFNNTTHHSRVTTGNTACGWFWLWFYCWLLVRASCTDEDEE